MTIPTRIDPDAFGCVRNPGATDLLLPNCRLSNHRRKRRPAYRHGADLHAPLLIVRFETAKHFRRHELVVLSHLVVNAYRALEGSDRITPEGAISLD